MRSVPGGLSEKLRQPEEEIYRIVAGTLSSLTASDHEQWRGQIDESAKQASTEHDILAQRTHSTFSSSFASLPHVTRLRDDESSVCNTTEKISTICLTTPEALPKSPTRDQTVQKINISDATPEALPKFYPRERTVENPNISGPTPEALPNFNTRARTAEKKTFLMLRRRRCPNFNHGRGQQKIPTFL